MENASKALIIAGAILLAILIIGIGMVVYNNASKAMGDTGMDEYQIQAYNSKFESYEGSNVSGSNVRNLVNAVTTHNRLKSDDPSLQIKITRTGTANTTACTAAEDLTTDAYNITKYPAARSYTVKIGYEKKSNYIVGIDIKEN